jgi:hypothetical protein
MRDILDVIKNVQFISENNSAFKILLEFERVLDELDIYVFDNWIDGELIEGPKISKYNVSCTFMWPKKKAPDIRGMKRLKLYGCEVEHKSNFILVPRKIKDPGDFRPGTKKGKIDAHPIWLVTVNMPKKLIHDVAVGKANKEQNRMSEYLKYNAMKSMSEIAAESMPPEGSAPSTPEVPGNVPPPA